MNSAYCEICGGSDHLAAGCWIFQPSSTPPGDMYMHNNCNSMPSYGNFSAPHMGVSEHETDAIHLLASKVESLTQEINHLKINSSLSAALSNSNDYAMYGSTYHYPVDNQFGSPMGSSTEQVNALGNYHCSSNHQFGSPASLGSSLRHSDSIENFNPWPQHDPYSYTYEPYPRNHSYHYDNSSYSTPQTSPEQPKKSNLECMLEGYIASLTRHEQHMISKLDTLETCHEELENQPAQLAISSTQPMWELESPKDEEGELNEKDSDDTEILMEQPINPETPSHNFNTYNAYDHSFDFSEKQVVLGSLDEEVGESDIAPIGDQQLDMYMTGDDEEEDVTDRSPDLPPTLNIAEVKPENFYNVEFEVSENSEPRYDFLNPDFKLSIAVDINLNDKQMIFLLNKYRKSLGHSLHHSANIYFYLYMPRKSTVMIFTLKIWMFASVDTLLGLRKKMKLHALYYATDPPAMP